MEFSGKSAVVCGSTQGIGFASAKLLAERGANVTLIARNEQSLKTVLNLLPVDNNQIHQYVVADFSNPDSLKKALTNYLAKGNKPHILVNNTGGPKAGPIRTATVEEFLSAFNQHLICNHILVQAFYPLMIENSFGRIINIISTSVKQPLSNLGVSNTIRGAVANWSKTLANELGQYNITVNNVLPGATNTDRLKSIAENKASQIEDSVQQIYDSMASEVPMKRIAEPNEIAEAVAFLASDRASYINGINVPVDGGRTKSL